MSTPIALDGEGLKAAWKAWLEADRPAASMHSAVEAAITAYLAAASPIHIPQEARADRWPAKGDRMTFMGQHGYPGQLEHAKTIFEVGAEYEVERCEVGDWSHSVWFKGIEGSFNGVMFSLSPAPASRQDTTNPRETKL